MLIEKLIHAAIDLVRDDRLEQHKSVLTEIDDLCVGEGWRAIVRPLLHFMGSIFSRMNSGPIP